MKSMSAVYFTLRLVAQLSLIACLCLVTAKVVGHIRHRPLLVYAGSDSSQKPTQYPMFLVDVEMNFSSRLKTGDIYSGAFPACSVNGQIAFSTLNDPSSQIYVTDPFSASVMQITHNPGIHHLPIWSPDGRQLAFLSGAVRSTRKKIYVVDMMSGEPQPIIQNDGVYEPPAWSPDGSQLLFVSVRSGHRDIYTLTLDDFAAYQLTNNEATQLSPAWSPDGQSIAFASDETGSFDIYVMDSGGGKSTTAYTRCWRRIFSHVVARWTVDCLRRYRIFGRRPNSHHRCGWCKSACVSNQAIYRPSPPLVARWSESRFRYASEPL